MVINYHKGFIRASRKLTSAQKEKLKQRLALFGRDQFDPILNNHALKGKYLGFRSINIGGDLRAIFRQTSQDELLFTLIDTHSNLYG